MSERNKNYNNISDEELIRLSSNGDNNAFSELYERYSKKIYFFLLRMLFNDEEKSKDFVQNVFIRIIEKSESFDNTKSFKTWVFTIAANLCKNEYRHQEIKEKQEKSSNSNISVNTEESIINNIDIDSFNNQLIIEINKLDDEHKSIFTLKFQQNLSLAEISEIVDCPLGTVKSRLFYTLKNMAKKLTVYNPNIK